MKPIHIYRFLFVTLVTIFFGVERASAQFLLQAPNSTDEHNYKWYEASDTTTVLGTDFFYEATASGIYFATYDGTLCGSNATGYFIVTDCKSPDNEVTLDISNNVSPSTAISWSPAVGGDQLRPTVIATESVVRYTATVTKAGNSFDLPNFTVVCLQQSSVLVDDFITVNEDSSVVVPIFDNDSGLPTDGILTTSNPFNGNVLVDDNGTPNNPSDDVVTYVPNPNFNGSSTFTYTICNALGDCSTATVNVEVIPIVDAFDDSVATLENTPVDIDFLMNDNDVPIQGTITTTSPSNGNVVVDNNGTVNDLRDDILTYTPNNGYVGSDMFTYTICDNQSNCSTANINILVNPMGIVDIDSDDDGILDSFEDLNLDNDNDPVTDATDSDGDGIPDYLDIDSDNDGIPDNVEAQTTLGYIAPSAVDANNNGLDDAYESNGNIGLFPIDTDGDSLPDYLDDDSDNDNVPDNIEGHDHDHDGIPDVLLIGSDKDNDGLDDGYEGNTAIDVDVNDEINDPYNDLPNTDIDDEVDYRDADDDDDGILTVDEDSNTDGNYANDDFDADGTPDYLDSDLIVLDEELEVFNVITPNNDGIHDVLTIKGIENYPNNTIKIYNRWGVLVYATKAYNNDSNYFDGTSEGRVTVEKDNQLPVGTYFYILEYTPSSVGKMTTLTGYIYINR
ncbi:gliding motility-associated C-terminal domain-containing protein [Arenibacter aquaticus]|uniref:Gliding motility-associated C-terminal domain-containing protein n=1 Tax=Arenibacter aquaticus TaxID=2489054 RepID=A0A3S0AJI9_9FLAO|nr:gliding motility-associated C-terminal domain-containing protein [Arenibacter aquaticus]RTE51630.1 gliding motility-associated C-terminal domain-containing protein [Arenibacter aquaticus]